MKELALYTCFFGTNTNWANCIPPCPEGIDCYFFTNNVDTYEGAARAGWKCLWVNLPQSPDSLVCAEQTKHLRCCPHAYPLLRPYRYLCWTDSKLKIPDMNRVWEMVADLESSSAVWAFTKHPLPYTDVWGEFTEAMKHEKYARQQDQARAYIESRLLAGFDEHRPQRVCCGFNIRKQGPAVNAIGDFWLSEIHACGIEDQISFQFVHQRYEDAILLYPYQFCWSYI